MGSTVPKAVLEMYFSISCQLLAATSPKKTAITKLKTTVNFLTTRLSKLTGRPINAAGNIAVQEIFERIAKEKLASKKIAAKTPADENNAILATRDVIKICVWPTSENHHQSVTKATILEKSIKTTKIPIKKIRTRYFGIVVIILVNYNNTPLMSQEIMPAERHLFSFLPSMFSIPSRYH